MKNVLIFVGVLCFTAFSYQKVTHVTVATNYAKTGGVIDYNLANLPTSSWAVLSKSDGSDIVFTTLSRDTLTAMLNDYNLSANTGWAHIKINIESDSTEFLVWCGDTTVSINNKDSTVFSDYVLALSMDVQKDNMARNVLNYGDASDDTSGVIGRARNYTATNLDWTTYVPYDSSYVLGGSKQFDPDWNDYDAFGRLVRWSPDTVHYFYTAGTDHGASYKIIRRRKYAYSTKTWSASDSVFGFTADFSTQNPGMGLINDTTVAVVVAKYHNSTNKYHSIGYVKSLTKDWTTWSAYTQLDTAASDSAIFGATGSFADCRSDSDFVIKSWYRGKSTKWITLRNWIIDNGGDTWTDQKVDSVDYPVWMNESTPVYLGGGKFIILTCNSRNDVATAGGAPYQHVSSDYATTWGARTITNIGDTNYWKVDPSIYLSSDNELWYAGVYRGSNGLMISRSNPDTVFTNPKGYESALIIDKLGTSFNGYASMDEGPSGEILLVYSKETSANTQAKIYGYPDIRYNKKGTMPFLNTLPSNQLSISFWAKHHDPAASGNHMLFDFRATSEPYHGFFCNISGNNYYYGMSIRADSYMRRTGALPTPGWHNYTYVFDISQTGDNKMKLYIDGVASGSIQQAGLPITSYRGVNEYFILGSTYFGSTNNYTGSIDEFRFANYAKSADEVVQEYNMQNQTAGYVTSATYQTPTINTTMWVDTITINDETTEMECGAVGSNVTGAVIGISAIRTVAGAEAVSIVPNAVIWAGDTASMIQEGELSSTNRRYYSGIYYLKNPATVADTLTIDFPIGGVRYTTTKWCLENADSVGASAIKSVDNAADLNSFDTLTTDSNYSLIFFSTFDAVTGSDPDLTAYTNNVIDTLYKNDYANPYVNFGFGHSQAGAAGEHIIGFNSALPGSAHRILLSSVEIYSLSNATLKVWTNGNGDNNWFTSANWNNGLVPTANDTVEFNSDVVDSCFIDGNAVFYSLRSDGYTGTINMGLSADTCFGNMSVSADATIVSGASTLVFAGTDNSSITSNSADFNTVSIEKSSGEVSSADDFTCTTLSVAASNVFNSDYGLNVDSLYNNGTLNITNSVNSLGNLVNDGEFALAGDSVTITGNVLSNGNLTIDAASFFTFGGANQTISFVGDTVPVSVFTGSANIDSGFTFNKATFADGKTYTFDAGKAFTMLSSANADWSGSAGNLITYQSSSDDTQYDIDVPDTLTVSYVDVQDFNATNGGFITSLSTSINSGNDSGWVFNAVPASGNTSVSTQYRIETFIKKLFKKKLFK